MGTQEGAGEVHRQGRTPLRFADLFELAGVNNPRVVDENVDPSPARYDLLDQAVDFRLLTDIGAQSQWGFSQCGNLVGDLG